MKSKAITLISVILSMLLLTGSYVSAASKSSGTTKAGAPVSDRLSYGLDVISDKVALEKSVKAGESAGFEPGDFTGALGLSDVASITVLTLPDQKSGKLTLSGISVMKNQIIARDSISRLKFECAPDASGECAFTVGVMNNERPLTLNCVIKIESGDEKAPEKGSAEIETIEQIPCLSRLRAIPTENRPVCYQIVSYPEKGTIEMLDRIEGEYRYTPVDGFTGSDSFRYVMIDEKGKRSEAVSVSVSVRANTTGIIYCDMDKHPAALDAMILAEKGIMKGKSVCGISRFEPDAGVRRDEFLAMALMCAGTELGYDPGAVTAFADDRSIPADFRSYVAYASDKGFINGVYSSGGNKFSPASNISVAEASVMIYNILGISPSGDREVFADGAKIPDWAVEAMSTLADRGVLETGSYRNYSDSISRADAAKMLVSMIGLVNEYN